MDKTFAECQNLSQVGMAHPNFMEKTFADGSKTVKFVKVSPSKVFHYTVSPGTWCSAVCCIARVYYS